MFTTKLRDHIRDELIALAQADTDIVGAALVGSSATGLQDAFSDIDLALQLAPDVDEAAAVDRWTRHITERYGVAHHLDVYAGNTRYRVYLLPESLQIDISFWAHNAFVAIGDRFTLLFGAHPEERRVTTQNPDHLIGYAWLYALHVRSSIARNQPWHALSLLDDMRDYVLMLACIRHGLNPRELRGVDDLPSEVLSRFTIARAISLQPDELRRSLRCHGELLLTEVSEIDANLADQLSEPVREIMEYGS